MVLQEAIEEKGLVPAHPQEGSLGFPKFFLEALIFLVDMLFLHISLVLIEKSIRLIMLP